jgi:hypothetical protein
MKTTVIDLHKVKCPNCKGKKKLMPRGHGKTQLVLKDCPKCNGKGTIRPDYDQYIGRAQKRTKALREEFPYNSKWYNPFKTAEEYEPYIRAKIKKDPKYYNLNELRGFRLGCWCGDFTEVQEDCPECSGWGRINHKLDKFMVTSQVYLCDNCNGTGNLPMKCHGQVLIKLIRERFGE